MSTKANTAFAGHPTIQYTFDPNNPVIPRRLQEVVVFVIVAGILAVNSRRNMHLLYRQANIIRERSNLARHFPPNIVEQMAERDEPLGAVRDQEVAVMFVDIVGFTRMAEQQQPEQTVALLRNFHGRLENVIFNHNGTLDKFLGDGLMATFGTPEAGPDDALNALNCSRDILAAMDAWNAERQSEGQEPLQVSIGIHYGPVVMGDIGSKRRLEFAVLGDTVNVASRLETLTRTLNTRMALSDAFIRAVRRTAGAASDTDLAGLDNCGTRQLRGRAEPIEVWSLS